MSTKLTDLRTERKMTLEQLSQLSGVPLGMLRRMEDRGERCSRKQLQTIAKVLKVKPEIFLD